MDPSGINFPEQTISALKVLAESQLRKKKTTQGNNIPSHLGRSSGPIR